VGLVAAPRAGRRVGGLGVAALVPPLFFAVFLLAVDLRFVFLAVVRLVFLAAVFLRVVFFTAVFFLAAVLLRVVFLAAPVGLRARVFLLVLLAADDLRATGFFRADFFLAGLMGAGR